MTTIPFAGGLRSDSRFGSRSGSRVGTQGAALLLCGVLFLVPASPTCAAEEIRGQGNVLSGNEITVGTKTVMLFGMAAPDLKDLCEINEAKLKCGVVAWAELIKLVDGQLVSCDKEDLPAGVAPPTTDKSAIFATCYIGETDINEAMVRSGWARAVPQHTDRYEVDENDARESGRGLWASETKSSGRRR